MSRTNPYKQKRRRANRTLLIFGEGLGEEMFLKHLRRLYSFNMNIAITIKRGKGGTADKIVIDADRIPGDFDKRIVVLDDDKSKIEMTKARQEAKNRIIKLIENKPCLESVLISILNKKPDGKNSVLCKSEFESKYLNKKKRGEPREYMKLFPKELLDSQRLKIQELNKLIFIMEGR